MGSYSIVITENMSTKKIYKKLEDKFKQLDNVEKVVSIADLLGSNVPVEMLPDNIKDIAYKDGDTAIFSNIQRRNIIRQNTRINRATKKNSRQTM